MIAFALAIIILVGALIQGGSNKAAGDARSALFKGASGGTKLGQVITPGQIAHAGDVPSAGAVQRPAGPPSASLALPRPPLSSTPAPPPPPPGPKVTLLKDGQLGAIQYAIQGSESTYTSYPERDKGGNITGLTVQRLGVLKPDDPRILGTRRALGGDYSPDSFDTTFTVWDQKKDGGRAISGPNGVIGIDTPRATVNFQPSGVIEVYNKTARITYSLFPDGTPRSLYDSDGSRYDFRYNDKDRYSLVKVDSQDKDKAGTWRRGDDGTWTRQDGKKWAGAGGPDDWFKKVSDVKPGGDTEKPKGPKRYVGDDPPKSISNAQELAKFVWSRYDTDNPIGIIKVKNASKPTYVIVLSGTEPTNPGQATYFPEDIFSSLRIDAADHYHGNILKAIQDYGIPKGADIIVAGHSLGGIEAQNVVSDKWIRDNYNPIRVVTYGSPVTSFNPTKAQYDRFSAWNDPVANFASLASANYSFWKTVAWGGHYILKWGSLGNIDRRPVEIQTRVGPTTPHVNLFYHHSIYPDLPELQKYPVTLPNGRPLELDPDSYRSFDDPSHVLRPFFKRKFPK